jgi:hypothetical protein
VPAPTQKQIDEARVCDVAKVAQTSYPSVAVDDLPSKFKAETACEWAALAAAYVRNRDSNAIPLPIHGEESALKAISMNPALAFSPSLLYGYLNGFVMVEAPPSARQPIKRVDITLEWGGGLEVYISQINYKITITRANTEHPVVYGYLKTTRNKAYLRDDTPKTINDGQVSGTVDTKLVQALGPALTDLLPVKKFVSWVPCTDNYPDWHVTLTFADGSTLNLVTNGSNLYFHGAPWQTTINKQKYVQFSAAFLVAISDLTDALKLPAGSTEGMFCSGIDDPFGDAFGPSMATPEATPQATKTRT